MHTVDKARWPVLSPLLDELLELAEPARGERLAALHAQDPALARDLSELLRRMSALDSAAFLDAPAMPPPPSLAGLAGQVVGAYTLERELGQGGMGSVWLARRTDGRYEGRVAIKFLEAGLFGGGNAGRFQREGNILARLDHPHIARLLDAGLTGGGGQPYLVLEYVAGDTIDVYCEQQALGVTARVKLFLDVLSAVSHAHARLILHRDLKPSNIMVTAAGQVKLLDFGIAKLLDDATPSAAAGELTQRAGNAYTPQFAAPEQVQGGEVTTATDVYALGVMLYLLLAGQHPTLAVTEAPLDRMRAVVEVEPRRLSAAVMRQDGSGAARRARELRGDLDTIVARALKKPPAERYPNAADLADDLRRWLGNEPIAARRDGLAYRAAKFVRRNRLGVAAGSVTALALAGGIGVALWEGREARRQQAQAEGLIEFMLGDLRKKLQPVGRLDVLDAVGGKALDYYARQNAGRLDAGSLGRRARALHLIGEIAEQRGQLDEAARSFREAAEATAALLARSPQDGQRLFDHAQSEYWVGYIAWRKGEFSVAEAGFARYLALAQQLTRLDPANSDWRIEEAWAQQNLGVLYLKEARWPQAKAAFESARTVWDGLVRKRPELSTELAGTLGWLAIVHEEVGAYETAIDLERAKVAALADATKADTDQKVQYLRANAQHAIARRLLSLGRIDQAAVALQDALGRFDALTALDPANLDWQAHDGLSRVLAVEVLAAQSRPEEARKRLSEVDAVMARLLAASADKLSWQVNLRGQLLTWHARLAVATPALVRELDDYLAVVVRFEQAGKSLDADQARTVATVGFWLGNLLAAAGRRAEALDRWQDALARSAPGAEQGHLPTLALRASILLRMGSLKEARLLADRVQTSAYRHPDTADLRQRLAQADRAAPGN